MQKILEFRNSQTLLDREKVLRVDIEEVLFHEEFLWYQKSRAEWLQHGDRNTSFFHNRTLVRKKRNKIEGLLIGNDWCFDDVVL